MNEYRCPCGYHVRGSIAGILAAAKAHKCPPILCPECGNGKCVNCIEQTLNDADEWVPCGCPEHGEPK